eukprot:3925383-Pyramimonas_sp.AAC.1
MPTMVSLGTRTLVCLCRLIEDTAGACGTSSPSESATIRDCCHQRLLSSETAVIRDCYHQRLLPSETAVIRDCCHQRVLPSETATIRDCYHQRLLPSETAVIRECCHQRLLSSKTAAIRECCHQRVLQTALSPASRDRLRCVVGCVSQWQVSLELDDEAQQDPALKEIVL